MEYPKPIMTKRELMELGYKEEWLMEIYRSRRQDIAWKIHPNKRNSPILFDTSELEKYRRSCCTGV